MLKVVTMRPSPVWCRRSNGASSGTNRCITRLCKRRVPAKISYPRSRIMIVYLSYKDFDIHHNVCSKWQHHVRQVCC